MKEIKKIFKINFVITALAFFIGILTLNKYLYFGITTSSLISIYCFYSISEDSKRLAFVKDIKKARKIVRIGYAKRYAIHLIYLIAVIKIFGEEMFYITVIGLFILKFTIYINTFINKFKNDREKNKKGGKKWD